MTVVARVLLGSIVNACTSSIHNGVILSAGGGGGAEGRVVKLKTQLKAYMCDSWLTSGSREKWSS